MTPADFQNWLDTMGLKKSQAAKLLGYKSTTSIDQFTTGIQRGTGKPVEIPLHVALACAALHYGLKPWPEHTSSSDIHEQ